MAKQDGLLGTLRSGRRWGVLLAVLLTLPMAHGVAVAQELKCSVTVNGGKIAGTNRSIFKSMQKAITEFMNNTHWTKHVYSQGERIECTLVVTLSEQSGPNEYSGSMNLQSRRPVYNSSYKSPMLNLLDNKVQFTYRENEPLEYSEVAHLGNLTSLLAYYAYIILGYDYDSFSPMGGTPYFELAKQVVRNAQSAPEKGWKAYEGDRKNRYWMVEYLLDDKYRSIRQASYTYHRQGLDAMEAKASTGRNSVMRGLRAIQGLSRSKPDSEMLPLSMWLNAKRDELINIFKGAEGPERKQAHDILVDIDRKEAQAYDALKKSGS